MAMGYFFLIALSTLLESQRFGAKDVERAVVLPGRIVEFSIKISSIVQKTWVMTSLLYHGNQLTKKTKAWIGRHLSYGKAVRDLLQDQ